MSLNGDVHLHRGDIPRLKTLGQDRRWRPRLGVTALLVVIIKNSPSGSSHSGTIHLLQDSAQWTSAMWISWEVEGVLDGFPGVGMVKWMNGIRTRSVMRGLLLSVSCPARMDRITLTLPFQWLFCTEVGQTHTHGQVDVNLIDYVAPEVNCSNWGK